MEVDKKFDIIKIDTEAQTDDPSTQKIQIILKANDRLIQLGNLKHQVKDSRVTACDPNDGRTLLNTATDVKIDPRHTGRSMIEVKFDTVPKEPILLEFYCLCANFNNVKNLFESIDEHDLTKVNFKTKDMYLKSWPTHRPDLYIRKKPKDHQAEITIKVMRMVSTGQGMRPQEGQNPVVVIADKEFKLNYILEYVSNKNNSSSGRDKFIWGTIKNRGQVADTSMKLGQLQLGGAPFVMMPDEQPRQALPPQTGNPTIGMHGHGTAHSHAHQHQAHQHMQQQSYQQVPYQQQQTQQQVLAPHSITSNHPSDTLQNPANNLPFNPTGYGLLSDHLTPSQREETIQYFNNQPYFNPDEAQNQQLSMAGNRLRHISIFHRNFRAALVQGVNNARPEDRPRFNDPERMTPVTPQAKDLGQTVRLLADDIRTFGLELIRLGAEFHRDPNFNGDDEAKENFRRLIQNNMDAARYLHPLLTNLTNITIPLPHDPPRYLSVYHPR
ncbi:unnamed protein product [Oikopleura dioica]|uniref:Uncharacterized protein n=2 Tax=Oikopleura dioica TaxID=34765 RepID=E4X816_OIKDI|nr:unnamed protein product [Oikopleura dioica]